MDFFFITNIITSLTSEWSPGFYHYLPGSDPSFSLQWRTAGARKYSTTKAYDPGGRKKKKTPNQPSPFSAHDWSHFRWSQTLHPLQQGNTGTETTNREQQVRENKDQKSRRLELTLQEQMLANKQTKGKQNLEKWQVCVVNPIAIDLPISWDGFEITFVTDRPLMERTLKRPSSDNSPQDNHDKCSQRVSATLSADRRWHTVIRLCQKKENAGWSF